MYMIFCRCNQRKTLQNNPSPPSWDTPSEQDRTSETGSADNNANNPIARMYCYIGKHQLTVEELRNWPYGPPVQQNGRNKGSTFKIHDIIWNKDGKVGFKGERVQQPN